MITIIFIFGILTLAVLANIKKQKKTSEKLYLILFLIALLTILFFIIKSDNELNKNVKFTKGVVKSFEYRRYGKYSLKYYFYVKGKKYTGSTSTYNFNCLKNKKCIGNEFTIAYSEKDPMNNEIDLEEFEKHRASIRFFEVDWKLAE